MTDERFTTELDGAGIISQDLQAEMAWERDRQLARAQWERRNDKHERPSDYRKPAGAACALPMKPVKGKKSRGQ